MKKSRLRLEVEKSVEIDAMLKVVADELEAVKAEIVRTAPVSSGLMRRALERATVSVRLFRGGIIGRIIAPPEIGSPEDAAPRGTIKEFLKDFPRYKRGARGYKLPEFAWFALSREARAELEKQRRAGRYGGETSYAPGRAPYFWVMAGHTEAGRKSAMAAGLGHRRGFLLGIEERTRQAIVEKITSLYGNGK